MAGNIYQVKRDILYKAICKLIEEYIQDPSAYPTKTVIAVDLKTHEACLEEQNDLTVNMITYKMQYFVRPNEQTALMEVNTDTAYELASSFFFLY